MQDNPKFFKNKRIAAEVLVRRKRLITTVVASQILTPCCKIT